MDQPRLTGIIDIVITTHCNRACPDCCCKLPDGVSPEHFPLGYLQDALKLLDTQQVVITGGEPMMHPEFDQIAANLRSWAPGRFLDVATNGDLWEQHKAALLCFDQVSMSYYSPRTFPGCSDNKKVLEGLQAYLTEHHKHFRAYGEPHRPKTARGSGKPCFRRSIMSFVFGKVYPCCVTPGIDISLGVALNQDWRKQLRGVKVPCQDCRFSPK